MAVEEEFTKWFDEQVEDGLIDFKLDVRSATEGTTKEEVMADILYCEEQIALGNVEEFPPESEQPSRSANYIICSCVAGTIIDKAHLAYLQKCEKEGKCNEYSDY